MRSSLWLCGAACAVAFMAFPMEGSAETAILEASKDNTLYDTSGGDISNGAGDFLFTGVTLESDIRRTVIAFPVAENIPEGSVILNASLTLFMSRTITGSVVNTLHRLLADWGEGRSDAPDEEGTGAPADSGDATWLHTFFPADFWSAPGGDFVAAASASADIGVIGFYLFTGDQMVADVQDWLDNPESNYGWILLGREDLMPTAKRFNSRTNPEVETRPALEIEYDPPSVPVERTTWGQIKAIYGP